MYNHIYKSEAMGCNFSLWTVKNGDYSVYVKKKALIFWEKT